MDNKKIEKEQIVTAWVGKGFHLYEQRNEWINWDGDTALVNRSGHYSIPFSLSDAEKTAEKFRNQGTKFIIDEVPVVHVIGRSGSLVISELFTDKPMWWMFSHRPSFKSVATIKNLMTKLPNIKWGVASLKGGHEDFMKLDGTYYKRTSAPGKGGNHMAWSLKLRSLDDRAAHELAKIITDNNE